MKSKKDFIYLQFYIILTFFFIVIVIITQINNQSTEAYKKYILIKIKYKMSFILKQPVPHEIRQQITKYQLQYGTQLLNCLLLQHKIIKQFNKEYCEIQIKRQIGQKIVQNIKEWDIHNYWTNQSERQGQINNEGVQNNKRQEKNQQQRIINVYGKDIIENNESHNKSQKRVKLPNNSIYIILHISFPYLQILTLRNSKLCSIQPLPYINCPNLKILQLDNNYITILKPLQKINNPNLYIIDLMNNLFNSNNMLSFNRVNMSKSQTFTRFSYIYQFYPYKTVFYMGKQKIKVLMDKVHQKYVPELYYKCLNKISFDQNSGHLDYSNNYRFQEVLYYMYQGQYANSYPQIQKIIDRLGQKASKISGIIQDIIDQKQKRQKQKLFGELEQRKKQLQMLKRQKKMKKQKKNKNKNKIEQQQQQQEDKYR